MRTAILMIGPSFAYLYLFLANRLMGWAEDLVATARAINARCQLP